jgi:hypothetical protein
LGEDAAVLPGQVDEVFHLKRIAGEDVRGRLRRLRVGACGCCSTKGKYRHLGRGKGEKLHLVKMRRSSQAKLTNTQS